MATTHTVGSQLKDAYRKTMDRLATAAERGGRRSNDVRMVAVTKHASPDQIRHLVELGHEDLGENRVQHLILRVAQLEEFLSRHRTLGRAASRASLRSGAEMPTEVRWHMVGHLQRNKVRQILPLVQLIHSVDSLRLAEELHNHASRLDRVVDVLLQVNASLEPSKFGVAAPAALHLAEQIDTMIHLRLRGIMAMAPAVEDAEQVRPYFARAAEIFHDIHDAKIGGKSFNALSMGMSHDFEVAVEEGANIVRIGQALFGDSGQA